MPAVPRLVSLSLASARTEFARESDTLPVGRANVNFDLDEPHQMLRSTVRAFATKSAAILLHTSQVLTSRSKPTFGSSLFFSKTSGGSTV